MALLLDTCAAIWLANDDPISDEFLAAMQDARDTEEPTFISPITSWEIGLLVARGRISLFVSPERWFERLMQAPTLRLADMSPNVLISSSFLPGVPPRDPADRILAATAREYGYVLVTRDQQLLDYADQGHVQVIVC